MLEFTWDESKRALNLWKHRIDFIDAIGVFEGYMLLQLDRRRDYGEDRWLGIGILRGRVVTVVFAEKDGLVRIISARRSAKHEIKAYFQKIRY